MISRVLNPIHEMIKKINGSEEKKSKVESAIFKNQFSYTHLTGVIKVPFYSQYFIICFD
jgi:hypothetical protein